MDHKLLNGTCVLLTFSRNFHKCNYGENFDTIVFQAKKKGNKQILTYVATQSRAMFLALKPRTTKTTREANTEVMKLMQETMMASRWQLLCTGL